MSYFTHEQDTALRHVIRDVLRNEVDYNTVKLIRDNDLLAAVDKNAYIETIKNDVEFIAEGDDIILTEEQLTNVTHIVESKYCHSEYNEFILEVIKDVLTSENDDENK